jgi:DNA-binding MarR family transcriptional regulator
LRGHYHCVIATTTTRTESQAEELTDALAAFAQLMMRPGRGHAFATMAAHDLSISQVRILHLLFWKEHEPAQVEIAEEIALSVAAAGRAIDTLVRAGLVERRADPDDRRVKRVVLTTTGRALVDEMAEGRRADFRDFVDQLDPAERLGLADALDPILSARQGLTPGRGCAP